ncbi:MAG: hypothetical protein FWH31_04155 [Streptococcaceae bacterium]|nr:hypothetical protein [Streptococcaceae bacterium]
MVKQNELKEYRNIGEYLNIVRIGKHIPYRIFEENGLSVKTFQRVVNGEADIRLSDLSIICEILSLSPIEVNLEAEKSSLTVAYRKRFMEKLNQGDTQETRIEFQRYIEYYNRTSFTLGKLSVLYMMQVLSYTNDHDCGIDLGDISVTEIKIIKNLKKSEIYTIFDLEFLALQSILAINKIDHDFILKVIKNVNIEKIGLETKLILEMFLENLLLGALDNQNIRLLLEVEEIIINFEGLQSDLYVSIIKKIGKSVRNALFKKNFETLFDELKRIRKASEFLFSDAILERIINLLERVEYLCTKLNV